MKKARETKTTYVTRSEQAISIPESLMSELQEMMKREGVPVEQFGLDRGEEALGDGVVPAIAAAAHAAHDPVLQLTVSSWC